MRNISWIKHYHSRHYCLFALSAILGIVYIASACLKFVSVDFFELTLVETGFFNWDMAPWMAMVIIGVELFLGVLFLLNMRLKEITPWFSLGLLICFSAYLLLVLFSKGNQENCNCFGSFFAMNPAQSLVKNILLIGVNIILIRYKAGIIWKKPVWIVTGILIVAFVIPATVNSLNIAVTREAIRNSEDGKVNLNLLYAASSSIMASFDLRKGRKIVVFLSTTCESCILTAYKFQLVKRKNAAIPICFILTGPIASIPRFMAETKSYNIPHSLMLKRDFISIAGTQVPVILFLKDGLVDRKINYLDIDQQDIENWLKRGGDHLY